MNNKKTPQPYQNPESGEIQKHLNHSPQTQHALETLDQINQTDSSPSRPQIPNDLREQWENHFDTPDTSSISPSSEPQKESWLSRLSNYWLWGGATALAALIILISLNQNDPLDTPSTNPSQDIILRGNETFAPLPETRIVFIPSESVSFANFLETQTSESIIEATDLHHAIQILKDQKLPSAAIYNAKTGIISPWQNVLLEDIKVIEITKETNQYHLSEALHDFINEFTPENSD